jgi:predicted MFS family arabinose efflux permease
VSPAGTSVRSPAALTVTLVVIATTTALMSSLGAPLLPTLARQYHVSLGSAHWILTSTMLTGAIATPVMASLAKGQRQRAVILTALATVLLGSVLAALSPTFPILLAGRALQGFGVGLVPVTIGAARAYLPADRTAGAVSALASTAAVSVGLGYPVTSVIAQAWDYRAAFWAAAAMVAVVLGCAYLVIPHGSSDAARNQLDVTGTALLIAGLLLLFLTMTKGALGDLSWWQRILLIVLAAALLVLWAIHQLHTNEPLVDLHQLRRPGVRVADGCGLLVGTAMFIFVPAVVEFVQAPTSTGYGFGASLLIGGLVLTPLSMTTVVATKYSNFFIARLGVHRVVAMGALIFAIAMLLFGFIHAALWQAFAAMAVAGFGVGFFFAATPRLIIGAVTVEETGAAMALFQLIRSIGTSTGSAISGLIVAMFTVSGATHPRAAGYRTLLMAGAMICLLTTVAMLVVGRSPSSPGGEGGTLPDEAAIDDLLAESARPTTAS